LSASVVWVYGFYQAKVKFSKYMNKKKTEEKDEEEKKKKK
jgi:hypothetical protein